jgi:hypothetical protein
VKRSRGQVYEEPIGAVGAGDVAVSIYRGGRVQYRGCRAAVSGAGGYAPFSPLHPNARLAASATGGADFLSGSRRAYRVQAGRGPGARVS